MVLSLPAIKDIASGLKGTRYTKVQIIMLLKTTIFNPTADRSEVAKVPFKLNYQGLARVWIHSLR